MLACQTNVDKQGELLVDIDVIPPRGHLEAIQMEFRWRADDGSTLNAGLAAL